MTDRPPVELWALRVFVEVATTRSMTQASARLGLTQSAVSQAMRRVEGAFGTALVLRGRRPVSLTDAGRLLARRAEGLLRDADRLRLAVLEAARRPAPEIRLGLVDSFAATAGPELIRALSGAASRVVVWSGLAPSLGAALLARDIDAVITSDTLDDVDGLARHPLWKEPFVLLLPRDAAVPTHMDGLALLAAGLPMIRYSARSHTGLQIERHLRRVGIGAERRIEVDGSDALVAMVAEGIGWAIATPLCLLQGAARAGDTRAVALPAPRFNRTLSLLCRQDTPSAWAARVADAAAAALRMGCLPRLRRLAPHLADDITLMHAEATP
jgi:DNA-binding transcriptional LysR family regulator